MIFAGGDPLLRDDLFELLAYATDLGVRFAVSPAASDLLNYDALKRLKDAGAAAISLSLDGAVEATHDSIRRDEGTYRRTIQAMRDAVSLGLNPQINTTIMKGNYAELPRIFHLDNWAGGEDLGGLLPGEGREGAPEWTTCLPEECETACNLLYDASHLGVTVRTVEAPFVEKGRPHEITVGRLLDGPNIPAAEGRTAPRRRDRDGALYPQPQRDAGR